MMLLMRDQEKIEEGRRAGLAEGRRAGRREANLDTARRLREMGMSYPDIHKATSLSLEELRAL